MTEPRRAGTLSPLPRPRHLWRRRLAHAWWDHQWRILAVLWALLMALGYLGFRKYYEIYPDEMPHAPGDLVYYTMQLVPMISGGLPHAVPWELEVARHLLPIVEGYAGIAGLVVAFSGRVLRVRLRMMRDHVVICGLGDKGMRLARAFHDLGTRAVVVERNGANPSIGQCRDEGIDVLVGDATEPDVLAAAGVARAAYLISVCREDGANAEVAITARGLTEKRRDRPLTCAVHIVDPRLCDLARARELEAGLDSGLRLELFNVLELGASTMLAEYPPASDARIGLRPHMLVVGLGHFGRGVVLHAARDWQPRFRADGERLRMSLIGKDARRIAESLSRRYPRLTETCELVAHDLDVTSPDFPPRELLVGTDGRCDLTAAYVCLDDESVAVSTGLSLLECLRDGGPRIVVRVQDRTGLAELLPTGDAVANVLRSFPLYERTCTPEVVLGGIHETLARAIHSEYVRVQATRGDTPQSNSSAALGRAVCATPGGQPPAGR